MLEIQPAVGILTPSKIEDLQQEKPLYCRAFHVDLSLLEKQTIYTVRLVRLFPLFFLELLLQMSL